VRPLHSRSQRGKKGTKFAVVFTACVCVSGVPVVPSPGERGRGKGMSANFGSQQLCYSKTIIIACKSAAFGTLLLALHFKLQRDEVGALQFTIHIHTCLSSDTYFKYFLSLCYTATIQFAMAIYSLLQCWHCTYIVMSC
jgi:hypothetical protein